MPIKNILFFLLIFTFSSQILFSIYYSSEILNQNNRYLQLSHEFEELDVKSQQLQTKLARETTIEKLNQYINNKNFQLITRQIQINNSNHVPE